MSLQHFTASDGAAIAYRDEGEGPALLCLAGLTRNGRDFDYVAPHLPPVRLVRMDYRGRGASQWTGAATYSIPREARDAIDLLDHLGIARAALLGTSRGGLIGMALAATAHDRLAGLCLNDVGPVLERGDLGRIQDYVGRNPAAPDMATLVGRLPAAMPGFADVSEARWRDHAERSYVETPEGLRINYDPALREAFVAAMAAPEDDLWPLFDACAGLPLALIRGANSGLLSRATAREMQRRRPDMILAEVPGRGHTPFLDEPGAVAAIRSWLGLCFA